MDAVELYLSRRSWHQRSAAMFHEHLYRGPLAHYAPRQLDSYLWRYQQELAQLERSMDSLPHLQQEMLEFTWQRAWRRERRSLCRTLPRRLRGQAMTALELWGRETAHSAWYELAAARALGDQLAGDTVVEYGR